MSLKKPTDLEKPVLRYSCPSCHVRRGTWCKTRDGKPARQLHWPRWYKADKTEVKTWNEVVWGNPA